MLISERRGHEKRVIRIEVPPIFINDSSLNHDSFTLT
jgi:hypothetical protein